MSKEWFILQYKTNSHLQATKNLNRQGFKTFLPLDNSITKKSSRFIPTTKPLFPGYLFITFDRADTKWHRINNTYGVSRLITSDSMLKSISTTFVNNLMKRYDSSGNLLTMEKLKKGDRVKVSSGPFANFIATVETYESEQRIWLLMDLMSRKIRIQTPLNTLQTAN
jgi:transcriptional antiterminator RfaH